MKIDKFWSIIETTKDSPEPETVLANELRKLSTDDLVSYQRHFDTLLENSYRWNLWGAAYVMDGGCSDDGFTDFRYGLISKGKVVFEKALENPDSLAELGTDQEISNELFGYVASEIYEEKTGEGMPRKDFEQPDDPLGEEWDFDDSEENRKRLPKLSEIFEE